MCRCARYARETFFWENGTENLQVDNYGLYEDYATEAEETCLMGRD